MITIMPASKSVMTTASKSPRTCPAGPAAPIISATPASATRLATSVVRRSRPPVNSRSSAAAANGAAAPITMTSATAVKRSALMKQTVAAVEQAAASTPLTPIARTAARVPRRCRQTMQPAMNSPAASPRQNSIVHTSSAIRRVKKPAVL
jgi:hypothetical protein